MATIDQRVMPAMRLSQHVVQAFFANSYVGAHTGNRFRNIGAIEYFKSMERNRFRFFYFHGNNMGSRWSLQLDGLQKLIYLMVTTFNVDMYGLVAVVDPAFQSILHSQTVIKRPGYTPGQHV